MRRELGTLPRHWQFDRVAGDAFRHFQEEACDPLLRALDQPQHALLNAPQLAGGQGIELAVTAGWKNSDVTPKGFPGGEPAATCPKAESVGAASIKIS